MPLGLALSYYSANFTTALKRIVEDKIIFCHKDTCLWSQGHL